MAAKAGKKGRIVAQASGKKRPKGRSSITHERDATIEKQTEERIAHLASFPELNPNPVTEVDVAGHCHYLNPASRRLFPDLQTRGLQHPWLKDLEAIAKNFEQKGETYHTRELKIGAFWYQQTISSVFEGRRLRIYGLDITARKQAEEALRSSEERYRGLYEAISGGVIMQDRNGTIVETNPAAREILGLTQDQNRGRTIQDPRWQAIHEDGSPFPNNDRPSMRALRTGIANQDIVMGVFNPSLDQYRWLLVNAEPILDPKTSQVQTVVTTFLDITDRKKREEELQRLNRTLTALSNSSKAMMRATDESEYLKEVCRIVVEDCGHKMVWVGFVEDDEGKSVRPVAHAGFEEGYLETLRITWADTERGRGPTGTAIRTGKVSMCKNMLTDPMFAPWRAEAIKRGYASSIVLPLIADNKTFGAINIYSQEPDPFSADEVKLLTELADDLAHGITALRMRDARAQAEEALRESEERLKRAEEIADLGSWELNIVNNRLSWSDEVYRIFGLQPQEFGATYEAFLTAVHPEDRAAVNDAYSGSLREGRDTYEIEHRVVRKSNGEVRFVHEKCEHIRDASGRIIRSIGMVHDITERKQAEEAILRAKEEWERTFDAVPDMITIMDNQHRIVRANRAMADRLGLAYEQCIGLKCYETVHGESHPTACCPLVLTYQDGQQHIAEVHEPRLGGDFLVSTTPLHDAQGQLIGSVHVARDITESKQMEDELRRSRDELEVRVQERTAELRNVVEALQDEMVERKEAEEAAKAEQQRFNDVLEILPAYVVLLTQDYHVPFANRVFRERFGESNGQRCYEFLFHRTEPCENCETYKVLKTNTPHHWEWTGPDGRNYDIYDFPFTDVDGSPLIMEMGIDITERKQVEEALKATSLYARSLIEASIDPLVTISAEGKVTDVNKATELATGISRDQLIGSDFSDYFTEPDKARAGYQKVFSERAVRDYPLAIRDTKGHITEVLYNATVYKNEAGEVQGVFAAARDITAQKEAEQERLRLIAAIEQSGESIVITDDAGKILYANPAFGQINDYPPREVLGKNYFDILIGDGRDKGLKKKLADILGRGQIWKDNLSRRKKDGSSYVLDATISPVRDQSGNTINYSIIERDVTYETTLEQQLGQQQKMEALGTLAGGIAHDFNNILMPIMINTELALFDTPESSPISQYLKTMLQAAQRGQELVKQITSFSRQKEQELSAIKITPVIKETLKFLKATLPKQIELREHFDAESGMIKGDPTQIHRVLMNLCSNAVHAMGEQGGVLEVSLAEVEVDAHMLARHVALKPGPYFKLTIGDTGHGMDQESIKRIFEPFYTTKKPGEGTGMGLAVVHGIVKRHGGAIVTYSEPGKGSTFNVFFPRIEGSVEQETVNQEAIPMGNERILLVDDEEVQCRTGRQLLERLGYTVMTQTDGLEALKVFRLKRDEIDLVITDQSMPRMTGTTLAEKMMRIRSDIPIILCTGFSEGVSEKEAKGMGIREFMMKPFSARQLAETIRRVLKKRG